MPLLEFLLPAFGRAVWFAALWFFLRFGQTRFKTTADPLIRLRCGDRAGGGWNNMRYGAVLQNLRGSAVAFEDSLRVILYYFGETPRKFQKGKVPHVTKIVRFEIWVTVLVR